MSSTKNSDSETSKASASQAASRVKEAAASTVAASQEVVASANMAYRDMSKKALEMTSKMMAFNQGTMAAYAESGRILTAESRAMVRQMMATGRSGTAESLSGFRALLSAKSVKEAMELQATLSRTAAIWAISEASSFARNSIDMVEKVSAPIAARAYLAAQTFDSALG